MKLHLPTALFALAVLPAVAAPEFIIDDYNYKEQYQVINLENYTTADGHIDLKLDPSTGSANVIMPTDTSRVAIIKKEQLELVDGYYTLSLGEGDKIDGQGTDTKAPKVLYIEGNLNLSDGAEVYTDGNAEWYIKGGIVADNVTVSGESTHLDAGGAIFNTLSVNGGEVLLRRAVYAGGYGNGGLMYGPGYDLSYAGAPVGSFAFSNVGITSGITVEDGEVLIGKSCVSNYADGNNRKYFANYSDGSGYFQSSIGGVIDQTGGTLVLDGMTYLHTTEIKQTGGEMTIAQKDSSVGNKDSAHYLRIDRDSMKVTQGSAPENANAPILNLQGIIVSGSNGDGSLKLEIEQTGNGTINMETSAVSHYYDQNGKLQTSTDHIGSLFKSGNGASVIKQSGSGTININSDYRSATFNVEQTGKGGNITIGATGKLKSSALTLTDAAKISVANDGLLELKDATLSYTVTDFDNTTSIDSITSSAGTAVYADGGIVSMSDGTRDCVTGNIVSVGVALSDEAFAAYTMNVGALAEDTPLTSFTVTLATGLTQGAVTFNPDEVGITTEASYTVGGESVTVAYNVENVSINGDGNLVATVGARVTAVGGSTPPVPEPATATLSLLALAGLCARRRRK